MADLQPPLFVRFVFATSRVERRFQLAGLAGGLAEGRSEVESKKRTEAERAVRQARACHQQAPPIRARALKLPWPPRTEGQEDGLTG